MGGLCRVSHGLGRNAVHLKTQLGSWKLSTNKPPPDRFFSRDTGAMHPGAAPHHVAMGVSNRTEMLIYTFASCYMLFLMPWNHHTLKQKFAK